MAQRIVTTHTCDMSGVESDEVRTHTFALDGKTWEIDLSPLEAVNLWNYFEKYIQNGRKAGKPARQSGPDPKIVRQWAREQGIVVPERGRISAEVVAQWKAAA